MQRGIWIDEGSVKYDGNIKDTVQIYQNHVASKSNKQENSNTEQEKLIYIKNIWFEKADGSKNPEFSQNEQILLKYCDKDGSEFGINGSVENIAGISNRDKNVFGLMPHPERAIESILGCDDGAKMLQGFLK